MNDEDAATEARIASSTDAVEDQPPPPLLPERSTLEATSSLLLKEEAIQDKGHVSTDDASTADQLEKANACNVSNRLVGTTNLKQAAAEKKQNNSSSSSSNNNNEICVDNEMIVDKMSAGDNRNIEKGMLAPSELNHDPVGCFLLGKETNTNNNIAKQLPHSTFTDGGGGAEVRKEKKSASSLTTTTDGNEVLQKTSNHSDTSSHQLNHDMEALPATTVLRRQTPILPRPGAYASGLFRTTRRSSRLTTPTNLVDSASSAMEDDSSITNQESFPEHHQPESTDLVQARRVSWSSRGLEEAQPVDVAMEEGRNRSESNKSCLQRQRNSSNGFLVAGVICLVVIVVVTIVVSLSLPNNDKDNNSTTWNDTNTNPLNGSNEVVPIYVSLELSNSTLVILESDVNQTSPQARALQWLQGDPNGWEMYSHLRLKRRFALATMYYATGGDKWELKGGGTIEVKYSPSSIEAQIAHFNSSGPPPRPGGGGRPGTGGSGGGSSGEQEPPPPQQQQQQQQRPPQRQDFTNVTSEVWLSYNTSECKWFSKPMGDENASICNDNHKVHQLILKHNNLTGILPEELGLLTYLKVFNLHFNEMQGTIVTQFGMMPQLQYLELGKNRFRGPIPSEIGRLSNTLSYFSVFTNHVAGTIPRELWQLSKMEILKFGETDISGTLPTEIGYQMPELKLLMLPRSQWSGNLPTSLGLCTSLVFLDASSNQFTGTIPSELTNISYLRRLSVADNQLSGTLPTEFGLLSNLVDLRLEKNINIKGKFPMELSQLNQTLYRLQLKGTRITGKIPDALCHMKELEFDCSDLLCGCDCPCSTSP